MKRKIVLSGLLLTISLTSCVSKQSAKIVPASSSPMTHEMAPESSSTMPEHNDSFARAGITHILSYTSQMFQYVVTLPQNWSTDDKPGAYLGSEGDAVFYPPGFKAHSPQAPFIVISSPDNGTSMNTLPELNEWRAKTPHSQSNPTLYKVANITVAGEDAVQYIQKDSSGSYYHLVTWFRKHDRNFYVILGNTEEDVNKYRAEYDLMLNNYSFIE